MNALLWFEERLNLPPAEIRRRVRQLPFIGVFHVVKWLCPFVLSFLLAVGPAHAQNASSCPAGELQPIEPGGRSDTMMAMTDEGPPSAKRSTVTDPKPAASVSPTTEAEARVQKRIRKDGVHIVHFWAPWCSNSINELKNGWAQLVADNPNVTFTFVTVWNENKSGAKVLSSHDLPDRVVQVTQPDLGPSSDVSNRRHSFLSLPVSWIPSTWIFHKNGELAFALNYGEMKMDTIQSLLDVTKANW
ncbi:MAG: TlpA family protein disulfide reductase [Salinibacter sp.]